MYYLVFNTITWFVFFGCYVKVTEMQHNWPGAYNIDEFINKLMISHRFDELAEKIADKAAVKIKSFGMNSAALPRNYETLNEHDDDAVTRLRINNDHTNDEEQLKKANEKNNNFRNTYSKDSSKPSERLSLKYKYLSQISPNLGKAQTGAAGKYNKVSRDDQEKPGKIKRNKTFSYEEFHGDDYRDKYSQKSLKKIYNNNKDPERKTNYVQKLNLSAMSSSNTDFVQNESSQDNSEPEDSQATVIEDLDESSHKVFRTYTDEEKTLRNISNVKTKNDNYRNKAEIHDSKKMSNYEETITSSTVKVYRREGDKEFTFQSDPEYAEYHENLAKLQENNAEGYLK